MWESPARTVPLWPLKKLLPLEGATYFDESWWAVYGTTPPMRAKSTPTCLHQRLPRWSYKSSALVPAYMLVRKAFPFHECVEFWLWTNLNLLSHSEISSNWISLADLVNFLSCRIGIGNMPLRIRDFGLVLLSQLLQFHFYVKWVERQRTPSQWGCQSTTS